MKLTQVLQAQHLGRFMKKHWILQGRKFPQKIPAYKVLEAESIPIYEPKDILEEPEQRTVEKVEVIGLAPEPVKFDKTHPNYKKVPCYTYGDNNVLVEAISQAKLLTNTVEIEGSNGRLPEKYVLKNTSKDLDARVKRIILNSQIFDAEQEKLPKYKDPLRPAYNFPRIYGVSFERRMKLQTNRLLHLVESLSGPQLSNSRTLLENARFQVPFEKFNNLMQFNLNADTFVSAKSPLKPITNELKYQDIAMPELFPVDEKVTLKIEKIYQLEDIYPFPKTSAKRHLHTIFAHYDKTKVANIFEEPVTEAQWISRGLLKAFTAAASYARNEFGKEVKDLPTPVTVQCIHTDGQLYHFSVFQLNTLDLELSKDPNGVRNIWFRGPRIALFEKCEYEKGRPVLEGYNNDVIKHLFAFYDNNV